MPPTNDTVYRHASANPSADIVLVEAPPPEDQNSQQPLAPCEANYGKPIDNTHGRPMESHTLNGLRGPPPPPPKFQRQVTQPVSSKNHISFWKKSAGGRDRERPAPKSADAPVNYVQHIQDLERLLRERESHIYSLERQISHQQRLLQEGEMVKQELLSIRQNLRLDDQDEPGVIAKKFGEINKKVDDIAVKFSNALSKSNARRELNTSDLFAQLLAHRKGEHKTPFTTAYPIDADEFIEFGCRSLLNRLLIITVLNGKMLNPDWDTPTNTFYYDLFSCVRDNETQVNVGRWRISTFKTIAGDIQGYCDAKANSFCDRTLIPFCQIAYDSESCQAAIRSIFSDIVALLNLAYVWHYRTRSTVLMLDFEVVHFSPGSQFNNTAARLESSEAKLPTPEFILLTNQLGLMSRKAMGDGNWEEVCQTQAVVLGNGYFSGGKP
ncbi:hypothetical protein B0J17DRAFT_723820 [Rhizoctonia solani]|nr:hypothetical protein B0J17DRAFT_723820 [Rhizoctonia solani]